MDKRFQQKEKGNGMLSENVLTALNIQMNHELTNFYVYKNFSGIADFLGLTGACKWFDIQANEEKGHFDKFYKYILAQHDARTAYQCQFQYHPA